MIHPKPGESLHVYLVRCLRAAQRERVKICAEFEGVRLVVEAQMNAEQLARAYATAKGLPAD